MQFQMVSSAKRFFTKFTFKRFFTGVNSFMSRQFIWSCKFLFTVWPFAIKWFFPSVGSEMSFKVTTFGIKFSTVGNITLEFVFWYCLMYHRVFDKFFWCVKLIQTAWKTRYQLLFLCKIIAYMCILKKTYCLINCAKGNLSTINSTKNHWSSGQNCIQSSVLMVAYS